MKNRSLTRMHRPADCERPVMRAMVILTGHEAVEAKCFNFSYDSWIIAGGTHDDAVIVNRNINHPMPLTAQEFRMSRDHPLRGCKRSDVARHFDT